MSDKGGARMILIGEKLNGAIPVIQKAITEKDDQLIRERVKLQADAGADFIDVHASRNEGGDRDSWMDDRTGTGGDGRSRLH